MRINHNIPALRSHHSLEKTNNQLDKTLQRLSTGLRINRAADDAAGLAIANKMQTQVRGLKVASRNSLDGVSLVQTAEGALNEVQAMLQRMRELSIQAANGTLAPEDRQAIQNEVGQLKEEITKTAELTEFNKIKLLNGQIDRRSFSDKENVAKAVFVSDTVLPSNYSLKIKEFGSQAITTGKGTFFTDDKIQEAGRLNINGEEIEIHAEDTSDQVFAKLRELCERVDIDINKDGDNLNKDGDKLKLQTQATGSDQKIEIKSSNTTLLQKLGLDTVEEVKAEDAIVYKDDTNKDGFEKTATVTTRGNRVEITDKNNQRIYVDLQYTQYTKNKEGNLIDKVIDKEGKEVTLGDDDKNIVITVSKAGPLQLHVGPNEDMQVEIQIQSLTAEALGLDRVNMRTAAGASKSIGILDNAINEISALRSKLGAYQNRLEHTINNLDVTGENTTAALSRIQDADMAMEMSEFTQKSILSQAGVAMLAQANQRPQAILQLLQG